MTTIIPTLLVALLILESPILPASADDRPKGRLEHLKAREERDSANKAHWSGRHRKLLEKRDKAELKVTRTSGDYARARRRRRNRGGPSGEARQSLKEAREELKSAESALEKFYDEARRAGAEPGWLRTED